MLNSDVGPLFAKKYSTVKLRNAWYICNKRKATQTVLRVTFSICDFPLSRFPASTPVLTCFPLYSAISSRSVQAQLK